MPAPSRSAGAGSGRAHRRSAVERARSVGQRVGLAPSRPDHLTEAPRRRRERGAGWMGQPTNHRRSASTRQPYRSLESPAGCYRSVWNCSGFKQVVNIGGVAYRFRFARHVRAKGPVDQFGVIATLSRWRPRVQIPSGPPRILQGMLWGRVAQLAERPPEKR